MSKTKKKLKLTEVLLIIEFVILAIIAAIVFIFGNSSYGSASKSVGDTIAFFLYSITFGVAGKANHRTSSLIIGAFFWINFLVDLMAFILFLKNKNKRQLLSVLAYLLGFLSLSAVLAGAVVVVMPLISKIGPKFPLVASICVVTALVYVMSIFCLLMSFIESVSLAQIIAANAIAEEKEEEKAEEEKAEEPVEEEKAEEPVEEEKPAEEPVEEEKAEEPVEEEPEDEEEAPEDVDEEPAVEGAPAFPTSKRKPKVSFVRKLTKAEDDLKEKYNELKAHILSYPVNSRLSVNGDTFRAHRDTYAVIVIAGKKMKVYVAVDPAEYANSPIPVTDVSSVKKYAETPTVISVRSDLSVRRAKKLIDDAMAKKGLTQGEIVERNYASQALRTYRRTK